MLHVDAVLPWLRTPPLPSHEGMTGGLIRCVAGVLWHFLGLPEESWPAQATVLLYTLRLRWMVVVLDGREDSPLCLAARPLQWNKIRKHR